MADVINAITRMKSLGSRPDWLKNMSDEELQANIQQLEAQQKNSRANAVQDTLQNVGNVFLQRGGLQPVQRTRGNDLNDFIVRETLKQRLREKPQANYSEESLPPGLWRDRTSGKIYKVPIEEVQENVGEQPSESNPQVTPLKTTVPEGFWRDEATGKVYRLPAKTPDKIIPTGAVPEGFWRDEATGKVYKLNRNSASVAQQKFDLEQQNTQKKQEEASQFVKDSAEDALNTIKEVKNGINYFGFTGGLPSIPGSPRAKWEANINKLLSKNVIDVMTNMKQASKTGATGFGQLSEKELKVLQDASTALKRNLSPKDATEILNDMEVKLKKISVGNGQSADPEYSNYLQSIGAQ